MENIKLVMAVWLPHSIRGLTAYYYDENGMPYYTIFINDKLSDEMQLNAYNHEISHIQNADFHCMVQVEDLEAIRHEMAV